jgi:hypothetical protein
LLGQKLTGFGVSTIAHITLPEAEHLADEVVLKEVHRGQYVEHSLLLHPVGETQELSGGWSVTTLAALTAFLIVLNLHNALSTDREVLTIKCLLILNDDEVVGTVVGWGNRFTVAVEELDGHVGAVLSEERNRLVAGPYSLDHVPASSVLADEVGLAELGNLVVSGSLCVDDLFKVIEVKGFTVRSSWRVFFLFIVLDLVELRHSAVAVLVVLHVIHVVDETTSLAVTRPDWGQLGSVNNTSGGLASNLVGKHGEGVLGQLLVSVETVKALVVRAVLSLGLGSSNGKDVGLPCNLIRSFRLYMRLVSG